MKNTTEYTLDELAKLVKESNQKLLEFSIKYHDYEFVLTPDDPDAVAKVVVTRKEGVEKVSVLRRTWQWILSI